MLKFITGNKGKFTEISLALKPLVVKQAYADLEELQDLDRLKILKHKVSEGLKHHQADFFIEDTCVYLGMMKNQFPGPFAKWFIDVLGPKGIYELCKKTGDINGEMVTTIAYAKNPKQIYFFEGKVKGKIVKPRGSHGFGMDPVFVPMGQTKTLSELKSLGSAKDSARYKAALKFKKFLLKK